MESNFSWGIVDNGLVSWLPSGPAPHYGRVACIGRIPGGPWGVSNLAFTNNLAQNCWFLLDGAGHVVYPLVCISATDNLRGTFPYGYDLVPLPP